MPKFIFSLITLAFVGTSHSFAFETPEWASGKFILDQYEAVGPGREKRETSTLQSGATFFGSANPAFSDTYVGKLTVRGSAFRRSLEKGRVFSFQGDLNELWLERRTPGFDLRVGEMITAWGKSDGINPTDFLTAKNYTLLSTEDEIRREGASGVRATFVPHEGNSPWEATLVWNARYAPTQMLIPITAVPAGLSVQEKPDHPAFFGDRQEFAAKVAYLAPSFDTSISFFDGRTHFGQYVWDGKRVALEYAKVRAIGTDFSITFDDFVFRGESAYFFYDSGKRGGGGLSLTEPNHWDTVLGIERPLGERFRILVQLLYRVHPSLQDPEAYLGSTPLETAIVRGIGAANALIQNYQDHSRVGATMLVAYTGEEERWTAQIAATGNFVGGDYLLRPKITRKVSDSVRLAAGMDYYGGPSDRPLGALRDFRSAFLEGILKF